MRVTDVGCCLKRLPTTIVYPIGYPLSWETLDSCFLFYVPMTWVLHFVSGDAGWLKTLWCWESDASFTLKGLSALRRFVVRCKQRFLRKLRSVRAVVFVQTLLPNLLFALLLHFIPKKENKSGIVSRLAVTADLLLPSIGNPCSAICWIPCQPLGDLDHQPQLIINGSIVFKAMHA